MSELKSYNSERIYWAVEQVEREAGDIDDLHLDDNLFYIKSDVDPVIAELNAQADFLKTTRDSCGNCNKCADGMGKVLNAELDKWKTKHIEQTTLRVWGEMQLRRNKYKRCLAMAGWCEATALWCYQAANTLPTGFKATLFGKPVMIEPDRLYNRFERLIKWSNRWLKIAEQFKEAK